jgi:hypothetical protein
METWKTIPEFPRYEVSDQGKVQNAETGRIMKLTPNRECILTVGMMYAGTQFRRSVPLLVAREFVPGGTEYFDTPINLDGDPFNCRANNLTWRPRWFAVKYKRQFADGFGILIPYQIRNIQTNEVFADSFECAKWYGVLEWDLVKSIEYRTFVWPVMQNFEVLR